MSDPTSPNLYEVLEVHKDATPEQLKKAFRRVSMKYHPDKNPGDKAAEEKFKEVNQAHEVLSDPEKRAKYDETGDIGTAMNYRRDIEQNFAALFAEVISKDADCDVLSTMRLCIDGKIAHIRSEVLKVKKAKQIVEKARKRLKIKNPRGNYMGVVLEHQLIHLDQQLAELERAIQFNTELIAEIDFFEYEKPAPEETLQDIYTRYARVRFV